MFMSIETFLWNPKLCDMFFLFQHGDEGQKFLIMQLYEREELEEFRVL